jgi:enoyl-CoA hydratase/carnithine racemase
MSDELVCERRDSVVLVRINRPGARNAVNSTVMSGIGMAVTEAEADPGIGVIVLTGTGERAFCAGEDLREFAGGTREAIDPQAKDAFVRLIHGEVAVPVVGAANGTAVGGGLELLLGCDVVVASSAAMFGLLEVKRGLFPGGSGLFLGTRVPLAIALEMALTGDSIDADRAYELGLVNQVVAPEQVLDAAMVLAQRIAANGPLAVTATKELVRLAVADHARTHERLRELLPVVFGSEDAKHGATAFVERRPPVWKGR